METTIHQLPQTHPAPAAPAGPLTTVAFWFDPACPWAWLTSRWMLEVAAVRPVRVHWQVMSLAVLNEEKLSEEHAVRLWPPVRVLTAAAAAHGDDVLGELYTAMGTLRHVEEADLDADGLAEALRRAGLPPELADAGRDASLDAAVRASHEAGMSLVGDDVGTPVLGIGERGIFGPVVSPAPRGERAGALWDAVAVLAGAAEFYELKRSRPAPPQVR